MAQERNRTGSETKHVRDVMTKDPECIGEGGSLRDVARIMKDRDTGVVPVVDGKRIIGMVTDRDIVVRGLAGGKDLSSARVDEVMTRDVRTVREDARVDEVLELMGKGEIRRLAVVNGSDEIVGIVSIGDISTNSGQNGKVGKAIGEISEAPPNN